MRLISLSVVFMVFTSNNYIELVLKRRTCDIKTINLVYLSIFQIDYVNLPAYSRE